MNRVIKIILFTAVILTIPVIPFLLWNNILEQAVNIWKEQAQLKPYQIILMTVILLTTDLVLPIPSSIVSVFTSHELSRLITPSWFGLILAVLTVWLGMTLAALTAWMLGKLGGRKLALRMAGEKDFSTLNALSEKYGAYILVLLRAVPVFAEASVLVLAVTEVHFWHVFFWPVALSNLGIALVFCTLGTQDNGLPLWMVFLASVLIPAIISVTAKILLKPKPDSTL